MQPFLETLAEYIAQTHGLGTKRIAIILPNRRAGLFLRRYLAKATTVPIWAPDILAIEDFIHLKAGYTIPDQVTLLFNLYKAYANAEGNDARTFDEFMPWGNMLLADFDEIDRYMVKAHDVFEYLSEAKAIENWNLPGQELTIAEKQYIRFYNSLAGIYEAFTTSLTSRHLAYHGLACRLLAESVADVSFDEWDHVIFAGFNALSSSEKLLIDHLLKSGRAEIRWDADEYYMNTEVQEAGKFLRGYLKSGKLGEMQWIFKDFATGAKNIEVIGVAQQIGQAKVAGEILTDLLSGTNAAASETAVVLVDENLLMPVLNSIPEICSELNVTMGYPLRYTPIVSLMEALINLAVNTTKYKRISADNKITIRFFHRDIYEVLFHPQIRQLAEKQQDGLVKNDLKFLLARSFLSAADARSLFAGMFKELEVALDPFFDGQPITSPKLLLGLSNVINVIRDAAIGSKIDAQQSGGASLDLEYLFQFALITNRLRLLLAEMKVEPGVAVMQSIIRQMVMASTVPFYGEPLKGLQVMGMLETRTIDFKNIIILSANEGLLPGSKLSNSFLPADIRNNFGLPGYREKNAIFAYHFYRLLQRSENAWLIYNTESDEMGGGEKSRFIAQLLHELPVYNPLINIQQRTAEIPLTRPSADFNISIEKSPAIMQRLLERAIDPERGFSPSRLNIFLTCALQFYFSEILGIKEPDEVDDTIDAMQLGIVVHKVLEQLFHPYIGQNIDPGYYKVMKSRTEILVEQGFKDIMPDYDFSMGKNALLVQVAKRLVLNHLTAEFDFATVQADDNRNIHLIALEHKMRSEIEIYGLAEGAVPDKIYLNGTADRIDIVGDIIRIIDYKTGSVHENTLRLASTGALLEGKKQGMSFQLMMYAFLFSENKRELNIADGQIMESGIASLRSFNHGLLKVTIDGRSQLTKADLLGMKEVLKIILLRLFNKDEPFAQTEDIESCRYCTFKSICNR